MLIVWRCIREMGGEFCVKGLVNDRVGLEGIFVRIN